MVSSTFGKQMEHCDTATRKRLAETLHELEEDPFTARSGADIRALQGTRPLKYRLRVGDIRIIYAIDGSDVKVIEMFRRGRGYRS